MRESTDDFEQLIAEMADAYTMYPSDRVWAKVQQQLPAKKSWPALWTCSIGVFLLTTLATYWFCRPMQVPTHKAGFLHKNYSIKKYNYKLPRRLATKENKHLAKIIPIDEPFHAVKEVFVPNLWQFPANGWFQKAEANNNQSNHDSIPTTNEKLLTNNHIGGASALANAVGTLANTQSLAYWDVDKALTVATSDRWQYEIHAAPSICFRFVEDEQPLDNRIGTKNGVAANSISAATTKHKAMLGTEIGLGVQYKINSIFSLKTGIQLNVQQADLGTPVEPIMTSQQFSVSQNKLNDTIADNNRVYQLSIPVGIQVLAISGSKWALSAGASLQPTYTMGGGDADVQEAPSATILKPIGNNGASVFKKWNINTSFDARFSYRLRNIQLYVGPQVRYQHFNNVNNMPNAYLPREMKVDYGCRIGIVAPL